MLRQTIAELIVLFFCYSVAGWCMEVILKYIQFHRFINRGFLIGPYCPIYGSGAVVVTVLVGGLIGNASYIVTFLASFVLCGLLKGGHSINDANDYFYANGEGHWFEGKRIENPNTHGTGCTLSSAIASNLAKGYELPEAVKRAKDYISGALGAMLDLGKGSGPMKHAFDLTGEFAKEVR